jgi:CBS domain-containing protein
MKVREAMTRDPVCSLPNDKAQRVAQTMRDRNVSSVPVVADDSQKLVA